MSQPWYVRSFQRDYLRIYAHRTDEAAEQEVEVIEKILKLEPGDRVLDLCCGNGRHSRQLAKKGYRVTGVDLSRDLLHDAENKNTAELLDQIVYPIEYKQYDVRHIPFVEAFHVVLNLFTSFGYFEETRENEKVFAAIHRSLKPEGKFLIDFLNPNYVRRHLVPQSERMVDGLIIRERRKIENDTVCKHIEVIDGSDIREYDERVRLFEYEQMRAMLHQAGLTVSHVYGSFEMEDYDRERSPRMIITGRK